MSAADITGDERQAERKKIMDEKRQQYASLNVMEVFGSKGSTEVGLRVTCGRVFFLQIFVHLYVREECLQGDI